MTTHPGVVVSVLALVVLVLCETATDVPVLLWGVWVALASVAIWRASTPA